MLVMLVEDNLIWLSARIVPLHNLFTRVSESRVSVVAFMIVEYQLRSF